MAGDDEIDGGAPKKAAAAAAAAPGDLSRYKKHDLRSHIYEIPGMWVGSVEMTTISTYVYDAAAAAMVKRDITYVPALLKIFDEILTNTTDQAMRVKSATYKEAHTDIRPVKNIRVSVDRDTGVIEVFNDGDSIDVEVHPEYNIYIPTMIFGQLLTSANYDQTEERLGSGQFGLGSKICNVFSKSFTVEVIDHRRKKQFSQTWTDNLKEAGKAKITAAGSKAPSTRIRFLPDYARFGMTGIDDDTFELLRKRTMDACANTDAAVSVYFNDTKVEVKDFERYADLFLGDKTAYPRFYESPNERWEVVAALSPTNSYEQVSWVNGNATILGGKHVDYITNAIVKRLCEMVAAKKKKEIKPQHIRENLMIFVKAYIVNPSFSSQTKEIMTTPVAKFGSKCELSDKFFDRLYKSGIVEKATALTDFHDTKKLAKTDGKKTSRVLIPKLDDANRAGTKDSADCTLILTEGDSAKTMAIAGLSVVGRDRYGVFPLKGKIMNVKDETSAKISANEEIANLKKILGLEAGKEYRDLSSLRYGRIIALVDADDDGSHIKGLLFNLFQSLWPSLYKTPGFLNYMLTPIVRATNRSGEVRLFYNMPEFERWKAGAGSAWKIRYLKGLGSSSESEAKEYFRAMKKIEYQYTGAPSDEALDMAFNKKRANDRKEWLLRYNRENVLDYTTPQVPYETFVNRELIHFSNRDNERSIPHIGDGLKESLRKILFGCLKRRLYTSEIKVAQLSGYISEVSAYHHGEASLQKAIVGMAQTFIGSNNINLLEPIGQFGTRIQGGADSASPRYIHTHLSALAAAIFREEDSAILKYEKDDDANPIEPEYYIPIVPLVLINGSTGIGSGFSTDIPQYNPEDVLGQCRAICAALTEEIGRIDDADDLSRAYDAVMSVALADMKPWFLGFRGTIAKVSGKDSFVSKGVYTWMDDQTVEITELPVGTWTDAYKEFLVSLIAEGSTILKDFETHCTAMNVRFILKLFPGVRARVEADFATMFKLVSPKNLSLNNMHLYTTEGAIRRFRTPQDIIREWACMRLSKYMDRKAHQLTMMDREFRMLSAKCRFIQDIIDGRLKIMNRKQAEVVEQLRAAKYPTFSAAAAAAEEDAAGGEGGYGYLTRMPIHHLTFEKKQALEREAAALESAIKALRDKTLQQIWLEELAAFETAWVAHRDHVLAEYEADRTGAAGASGAAAKKRRAPAAKR